MPVTSVSNAVRASENRKEAMLCVCLAISNVFLAFMITAAAGLLEKKCTVAIFCLLGGSDHSANDGLMRVLPPHQGHEYLVGSRLWRLVPLSLSVIGKSKFFPSYP